MIDLTQLVHSMNEYAGMEHDTISLEIERFYSDGSAEVVMTVDAETGDPADDSTNRYVISSAGDFNGHAMVEIREEPPIVLNAIPRLVLACLLEI
jgi:hypothetical protein